MFLVSLNINRTVLALTVASVCALSLSACGKTPMAGERGQLPTAQAQATPAKVPDAAQRKRGDAPQGDAKSGEGKNAGRPKMPPATVITATATQKQFASEVEALGTSKANEAVDIVAKVSNRVTAIRFREGQYVRAGDVLVELDAEEARADLAIAEASLSDSRGQVNRSRELFQTKSLSAQQMEQLESTLRANEARVSASKARLNELFIRAPFSGRVGLRSVSVGSLVSQGTVITTLDDLSVMKLDFSVPETYLAVLTEGLEIEAQSAAYPGQTFRGRVLSVSSRVDPVSRSIVVRAQIPNRDGKLKPGLFMTVHLTSANSKALMIPEQALVPERDKQFVFIVRDGKAIKTEIVVGRRRPGEVEVLKGLRVGDEIVSEGTQKVRDGVPVRIGHDVE